MALVFKYVYRHSGFLSLIWAFVIFILCATPGQFIPSVSWLELLSFDKLVHASVFFILCFFLLVYGVKTKQSLAVICLYFLITVVYGGLLEIMQAKFFSNRSADVLDFIANSFGALVAFAFFKKIKQSFFSCSL